MTAILSGVIAVVVLIVGVGIGEAAAAVVIALVARIIRTEAAGRAAAKAAVAITESTVAAESAIAITKSTVAITKTAVAIAETAIATEPAAVATTEPAVVAESAATKAAIAAESSVTVKRIAGSSGSCRQIRGGDSTLQRDVGRGLNIADVENFEIFSGDRIFVSPAEKTHVVRVLQFLHARWIPAELPDEMLDRTGVLCAAVNEFLFAIAFYLLRDDWSHRSQTDGNDGDKKQERDQDVATLIGISGMRIGTTNHHFKNHTLFVLALRQGNVLAIVIEHVLDFDRKGSDMQDLVAAIDDISFRSYE